MAGRADGEFDKKQEHGKTHTRFGFPNLGPLSRLSEASETGSEEMSYDASDMKRLGKKQQFKVS